MCLLTAATTFAEEITLKPNWKAGESKEYSLVQYEDTSKTSSIDVSVKILEDKENYKISCTYTNEQDYTGMGEMAKALLGKELYDKISQFVPIYTASKEGEILSIKDDGQPVISNMVLEDGEYTYSIVLREVRPFDFLIGK